MRIIDGKKTVERLSTNDVVMIDTLGGQTPLLAIIRVGEKADDIAYEKGAAKRMKKYGIDVQHIVLNEAISQEDFIQTLQKQNQDKAVNGILILQPLPKQIDFAKVVATIDPHKDVEGLSALNVSSLFYGFPNGYTPCTAQAVMETIETERINLAGQNVVIIGRSTVVGKPLALMMMQKQATVTVCNSKTNDIQAITKKADIVISAIGKPRIITADYVCEKTIVIDVGTNVDEQGIFCGDVDFDSVAPIVKAITPVPGGVGGVTTYILARNVLRATKR